MADIFISYSKTDRIETAKLSAFLESHGYAVWWDNDLQSGDEFRDVIIGELAKARAVIVIWSPTSINSDWVRSEAGRAHADRKLIPVRSSEIDYKQIPPPFDVLHTEPINNRENIRAAVVGQLAKPDTPIPISKRVLSALKYQGLNWFGICGAAITVFTGLKGVIELADWARWLIDHWIDFVHSFWNQVFGFLQVSIPRGQSIAISFVVFCTSIAICSRFQRTGNDNNKRLSIFSMCLAAVLGIISYHVLFYPVLIIFVDMTKPSYALADYLILIVVNAIALLVMFGVLKWLLHMSTLDSLSIWLLYNATLSLMFAVPFGDIALDPADELLQWLDFVFVPTLPAILMMLIGKPRPLIKRLSVVVVGLALLLILNKLSILGIQVQPPKG